MPRTRKLTPRYLPHKQSGRGRAVWTDAVGTRHEVLLPGPYESDESRKAYGKLLLEHEAVPVPAQGDAELTLVELLAAYHEHAKRHYRGPDGKPTSELAETKLVIKAVRELYGDTPAAQFGPLSLKAVRQNWIVAGLARSECNRRTNIVRRIFKWAAAEEHVPASVYHGMIVVDGLQRGRTTAHEPEPIGPVDDAVVDATLDHLNRQVAGLVELQRLTGMRPGEACLIRRKDIDTGGAVWLYSPHRHKTAHRGKSRIIAIGPRGQELLRRYFTPDIGEYLFSPRRAVEELRADRAAKRKTPRWNSQTSRNQAKRKKTPKRAPTDHYKTDSYSHAVKRACKLANVKHWHPNQLRHTFATAVRKAHGLEAAQVMLGHSRADVTQVYAERNESLAVAVAQKIG